MTAMDIRETRQRPVRMGLATRVRQIYREPKGVRKSDRIAGRPADGRGLPPASQYAWRVEPSGSKPSAGSTPKSSKHQSRSASITDVRSTEQRDRAKDTAREAQMRQQGFLKVLANNVGTHRMLRYMTHDYTTWTHRIAALKNARGGLVELNNQVRRMERNASHSQEDLDNARKRRDRRQGQLDHAKAYVDSLTEPLKDLNAKHFDRNDRIYDFIDVSRQSANLQCLPAEFWATYDDCNAAYTAGKDIELEIHDIEQEQLSILRQLDERLENSVLRGSQTSIGGTSMQATQHVPFQEPFENMAERIRELGGTSVRSHQLYASLETARDMQYDRESKLNRIAEDAFVAAGFLKATNDINEVKFHRRLQTARGAQGPRSERMSDFSGSIEGQLRSARQTPFKARLAARVRQARKNVKAHRRRLDDIRWRQLSNAGSIDSDATGQLSVRKMIQRTGEFREAEDEYRSILHRAQDDHAISESDQSSNFRDRESDGYGASALKSMGYPLAEKRKNCVREWMSGGPRRRMAQQIGQDAEAADKEGSWVGRVDSMEIGEDPETRDIDKWKDRILTWDKERQRLRKEGPFEKAENDFHPRNRHAVASVIEADRSIEAALPELRDEDDEDAWQGQSNPRILYNPSSLAIDLLESDHQAAQWIMKYFNGRWKMRSIVEGDP